MPRVLRRAKRRNNYSDMERRTLLTGVPVSSASTRFGHWQTGWNIPEIAEAWATLGDELREEWQSPEFDYHRAKYKTPFAERILAEQERALLG